MAVIIGNVTERLVSIPVGTISQIETMWLFLKAAGVVFSVYLIYLLINLVVVIKRAKRIKKIEERLENIEKKLDRAIRRKK